MGQHEALKGAVGYRDPYSECLPGEWKTKGDPVKGKIRNKSKGLKGELILGKQRPYSECT